MNCPFFMWWQQLVLNRKWIYQKKEEGERSRGSTCYILHSVWGTWTGNLLEVAQCNYDKHESDLSGQVKTSPIEQQSFYQNTPAIRDHQYHSSVTPSSKLFLQHVDRQLHVWQLRCLALLMSGGLVASQTGRWKPVDCFSPFFQQLQISPYL